MLSPPWRDFPKSNVKISRFDLKNSFSPFIKLNFKIKTYSDSNSSPNALSCEIIRFLKCFVVRELYVNVYKNSRNPSLQKNAITSELMKKSLWNFVTTILRPVTMLFKRFKLVSLTHLRNKPWKCVMDGRAGSFRAGPVHHGYRFNIENNNFMFYEPHS